MATIQYVALCGCDPLSVGSGGRLGGGGWFTREHWKGVAGTEFSFAEEGCRHGGLDFPSALEVKMDSALCDTVQCAETLGRARPTYIGVRVRTSWS